MEVGLLVAIVGMVGGIYVGLGLFYLLSKLLDWIWSLFKRK